MEAVVGWGDGDNRDRGGVERQRSQRCISNSIDEVAEDGHVVEKAMELASAAASMPAPAVRMVKEAVNATANALHKVSAYADADQSQLSTNFRSAQDESDKFVKGKR